MRRVPSGAKLPLSISESLSANADYDARITDGIRADDSEITIVTIVPKRCVLLLP